MLLFLVLFILLTSPITASVEYSGRSGLDQIDDSPLIFPDDEDYFEEGSGTFKDNAESGVPILILDRDYESDISIKKCSDVIKSSSSSVKIPMILVALSFLLCRS